MLDQYSELANSFLAKCQEAGLHDVTVEINQRQILEDNKLIENHRIQATGKSTVEKLNQLKSSLTEEEKEIALNINVSISIGDDCPALSLIQTSDGSAVSIPEDKVLLLDFWTTWCGPCQDPMAHNQQMLETNPDWEGKAEIIAISLDDEQSAPEQRVKERGWNKVKSYWAAGGFDSNEARLFNVEGIPTCALLNNRKVLWLGHPSELNLEENIKKLIAGEDLKLPPAPPEAGSQCPDIECLNLEDLTAKTLEFKEEDPTVYLVDFWATWCGPCQKPMDHNQEMLNNHPEWAGNAVIYGISLDKQKDPLVSRIESGGLNSVQHYWVGETAFGAAAPKTFGVSGIPCCLLVKRGVVKWRGHPAERKLDEDITHLISNDELPQDPAQETRPLMTNEEFMSKVEEVKALNTEFKAENPTVKFPTLIVFPTRKVCRGQPDSETHKIMISGEFFEKVKDKVTPVIERLTELFPEANSRVEFVPGQPTIQRGTTCSLCNKALAPEDTQFLCLFCEPGHYHCEECHNLPREGTGSAKFAHPHSLYKLNKHSDGFDDLTFGPKNLRITAVLDQNPENMKHGGVRCDNCSGKEGGCKGEVAGVRWKCAHCGDFDYCEGCEAKWVGGPSEEILKRAEEKGHFQWHVMFSFPFPR